MEFNNWFMNLALVMNLIFVSFATLIGLVIFAQWFISVVF